MKPQMQKYLFNDGSGVVGDCHRTCLAMILNMDRDDVPHFMQDVPYNSTAEDPESQAAAQAERDWLAQRGLTTASWAFAGVTLEDVVQVVSSQTNAAVILGCMSQNRTNHSVVLYQGEIHNPNGGEIIGPMKDGFWWITAISVGPNWQPRVESGTIPSWQVSACDCGAEAVKDAAQCRDEHLPDCPAAATVASTGEH